MHSQHPSRIPTRIWHCPPSVPPNPSQRYWSGIKIHDARMTRLVEVLLHGGTTLGGWTAKQVQQAIPSAFERYGLNQLCYDLLCAR